MSGLIDPLEFEKNDKMTDDVYQLGFNYVLRFTVAFSSTRDRKRYFFYKEYEYESKCDDMSTIVSIKRSFDYYLSIENLTKPKDGSEKLFIRITPCEFPAFRRIVKESVKWFTEKKYEKLFVVSKGKLTLTSPAPELSMELPLGKKITITPYVIDYSDPTPGIAFYFNDIAEPGLLTLDRLIGLEYTVDTFNMFLSAQTMVSGIGRPEPSDKFRFQVGNINRNNYKNDITEPSYNKLTTIEGRTVKPKGKKQEIESLE